MYLINIGGDDYLERTEDERLGQISDVASGVNNNSSVVDQLQNLRGLGDGREIMIAIQRCLPFPMRISTGGKWVW